MAQHGFTGFGGYHTCDFCGAMEGRVMTDSWTGKELCFSCAYIAAYRVTQSPQDEGDNMHDVLAGEIQQAV